MPATLSGELARLATETAREAGKRVAKISAAVVNSAEGKDIKLQTDLDSESYIFSRLKESGIPILSEEAGLIPSATNRDTDLLWVVDPLDGSLNFSRHIPLFCISIALWQGGKPLFGTIYNPVLDELLEGTVGAGASCNGQSLHVSDVADRKQSVIATGFPVYSAFDTKTLGDFIGTLQEYKKVRLLGTAALSLSLVARGAVEAYAENSIAFWDVAAGIALVLAAGGKVDYSFRNQERHLMDIFASNGRIG